MLSSIETAKQGMSGVWAKLRLAARLVAFVTATIVLYGGLAIEGLLRRRQPQIDRVNKWVPRWAKTFLWLFNIHVERHGPYLESGRLYPGRGEGGVGRIFVSNHRSSIDIPVALAYFAGHAISRHDLANWPLFGPIGKQIGTLYVDRSSRRSGAEVLGKVDAALKEGEGVLMFPEGTSHLGDEIHPFRPGAFKAAERAGAELVPLAIAYEDDGAHYYHEKFTTHLKRIGMRRRISAVVVAGEPILPDERSAVEVKESVQSRVEELVQQARGALDSANAAKSTRAAERGSASAVTPPAESAP